MTFLGLSSPAFALAAGIRIERGDSTGWLLLGISVLFIIGEAIICYIKLEKNEKVSKKKL